MHDDDHDEINFTHACAISPRKLSTQCAAARIKQWVKYQNFIQNVIQINILLAVYKK